METSGVADVTEVSESCVAGFGSRNRRNSFLTLKFDNRFNIQRDNVMPLAEWSRNISNFDCNVAMEDFLK